MLYNCQVVEAAVPYQRKKMHGRNHTSNNSKKLESVIQRIYQMIHCNSKAMGYWGLFS